MSLLAILEAVIARIAAAREEDDPRARSQILADLEDDVAGWIASYTERAPRAVITMVLEQSPRVRVDARSDEDARRLILWLSARWPELAAFLDERQEAA